MASPLISVVVCTYNRADLLKLALQSLQEQTAGPETFEVIVVDNASTDHTASVVRSFIEQGWVQLGYVHEPEQGLSVARNTGMRHARGEYVAYIDDDAKADSDWVENIARCAQEWSPDGVGGPIFAYYLNEKPDWWLDRYGVEQVTTESRYLVEGEHLTGVNMVFRKEVLEDLGGFRPEFGMKGDRLGLGEETDLIRRYFEQAERPTIYYSQDVIVYHFIPAWKMDLWKRWRAAIGIDKTMLEAAHARFGWRGGLARAAKHVPLLVWDVLGGQFLRDRAAYPYRQNYLFEVMLRRTGYVASLVSYLLNLRWQGGWAR